LGIIMTTLLSREKKMNKINHKLKSIEVSFISRTGSRNRLRIPVAGAKHTGIEPGSRVMISRSRNGLTVEIVPNPNGNYKVEKDGSVRFSASKFNLPSDHLYIEADKLTGTISTF